MIWRLGRRWRRIFYRGQHIRHLRREAGNHTLMFLPWTPPPPPADLDLWQPRITRWVRAAWPTPDETVINLPVLIS